MLQTIRGSSAIRVQSVGRHSYLNTSGFDRTVSACQDPGRLVASNEMEVFSRRSSVMVSFIGRRALVICRVHVMRGKVTTNCIPTSLVLRNRDAEFAGCFHQIP